MRPMMTVALLLISVAPEVAAQVRSLTLPPHSAVLDHEFSRVGSVRELADGRVLVTDVKEGVLGVADFTSGSLRPLGAKGAGPGEYRDLGKLIALRGDSTIMADASNRRALVLLRDRIVATLAPDDPLLEALGTELVGADNADRLIGLRRLPPTDIETTPRRDMIALVAVARMTMQADTIAILRGVELHTQATGAPSQQSFRTSNAIMSVPEQAAVFPRGDVAVALQDPYRVDWYTADRRARRGAAIERVTAPIDEAEKLAWKRRQEEWSGRPLTFALDRFPWAAVVPPFQHGALTAMPDGSLLIAREPWSGSSANAHDLIDRTGVRVGTLELPAGSRVVGTGRGVVFVAAPDDDGIEHLHRHPWPIP